jgi:thioredoxin 1
MPSPNVLEITDDNFAEALASPTPLLVDFTAAWCPPCRAIAPHVDALADAYLGRVRVGKCDADDNQKLVADLDVRSLPTVLVFKDGKVIGQMVGAAPRARLEALVSRALG